MKNVLVITSGILPVPAARGGAAEYLTQLYIDENAQKNIVNFDIATISLSEDRDSRKKYAHTSFIDVNEDDIMFKISRIFRFILNKIQPFYYFDNAFIHELLVHLKKTNKKYDLIVIENNPLYVKAIRKIYKNTEIILHLHNDYLNSKSKHHKYIFNNCKKIYTVSDYLGNRVKTIKDSKKVVTLYNGIDVEKFANGISIDEKNKIRDQFGLKKCDFVFLFAGRITKEKGIWELLLAFEKIAARYHNARMLVVGEKATERNNVSMFERKIYNRAKKLNGKIMFTGFVKYNEMPKIYQIADVVVVPSHCGEAFALAVAEGLSSGARLIVTNDGGIPEVAGDSDITIVDKTNLVSELYEAMSTEIDNSRERSVANQDYMRRHFDKNKYITRMLNEICVRSKNEK